jgi:hypothetical protein
MDSWWSYYVINLEFFFYCCSEVWKYHKHAYTDGGGRTIIYLPPSWNEIARGRWRWHRRRRRERLYAPTHAKGARAATATPEWNGHHPRPGPYRPIPSLIPGRSSSDARTEHWTTLGSRSATETSVRRSPPGLFRSSSVSSRAFPGTRTRWQDSVASVGRACHERSCVKIGSLIIIYRRSTTANIYIRRHEDLDAKASIRPGQPCVAELHHPCVQVSQAFLDQYYRSSMHKCTALSGKVV